MRRRVHGAWLALALAAAGCDDGDGGVAQRPAPQPEPLEGQTDFVSADGRNGEPSALNDRAVDPAAGEADDAGGDERTVEEGDIYRPLGGGLVVNLNAYRGVQIVDVSDPANPRVRGRVEVAGSPVELYVVGDQAVVLLNHWIGYWGAREALRFGRHEGGLVLTVDLADPDRPRVVDREVVPGYIQTSRLTREGERAALYVAAQEWRVEENGDGSVVGGIGATVVKSFEVTGGAIEPRSQLDLGGYVAAIQATPTALLVARNDWDFRGAQPGSFVQLIDIARVDGRMVEGDDVQVSGIVQKKTDMDLAGDVLRVVSAGAWGGRNTNHLETFDVSDRARARAVDHETFGDGQQLFATLFQDDRAFFVTYFRQDPFHAFEITAGGDATERSEYIVSGWNDWFKPAFGGTRLLGIGHDDAGGGRRLAVSLYDTTDLVNPEPLVARVNADLEWGWSEANWDDRAFTVLEDAADARGPGGERETGLVLLPFGGWDDQGQRYRSGVQIYTFSPTTLTRRGVMEQGTPVRRSFPTQDDVTANLSEESLSLYDTSDPDRPTELGAVELAPNYADLLVFGAYGVRLKSNADAWWYRGHTPAPAMAQIVDLREHPDQAAPIAELPVPAFARLEKVGDLLVAIEQQYVDAERDGEPVYETRLDVFDLANPARPREGGTLVTRDIEPANWGWGWSGGFRGELADCFDCGGWGSPPDTTFAAGERLAFVAQTHEQARVGHQRTCWRTPVDRQGCYVGDDAGPRTCYGGGVQCSSLDGGPRVCSGQIQRCETDGAEWTCEPVADDAIETREECWESDLYRYWGRHVVRVVDLSDAANPRLLPAWEAPRHHEAEGAVADGDTLYLSYKVPEQVEGDERPFVRYFLRPIDLSSAGEARVGDPVNVPGRLLAVRGDAAYTQDFVWGERVVESALARVTLRDGRAFLQARRRFVDQEVHAALLDDAGHLLVSHRVAWQAARNDGREMQKLTVLDAGDFAVRSESEIDAWATLQGALAGRALFQVSGGVLVVNATNPERPYAQAYLPLQGWPQQFHLAGDDVYVPAGRYGIYAFDIRLENLVAR